MKKIRRPNITIRAREVFYRLKRARLLGELDEDRITAIIDKYQLAKLIDPGCLYENFDQDELDISSITPGKISCQTASLVCATIGDKGFEAKIKLISDIEKNVCFAWAEAFLGKMIDLSSRLIADEAQKDSMELWQSFYPAKKEERELWVFLQKRIAVEEKIGIKVSIDPANEESLEVFPTYSKIWVYPWVTKKEKKQLAAR
ncbi:hypothetical protein ACFL6Y_03725 [Elusimicrobiota bacterium]